MSTENDLVKQVRDGRVGVVTNNPEVLKPIKLAVGFGRHDVPENPKCPSWMPKWLCTPISETILSNQVTSPIKGDETMAKQKPTKTPTTTVPVKKSAAPKRTSTGGGSGNYKKRTAPKRVNAPSVPETMANTSGLLDSVNIAGGRVSRDELNVASLSYPYEVDMFLSSTRLAPIGTVGTYVRNVFDSSYGLTLKTDINDALRKTNSVSIAEVATYLNVVSDARHVLLAIQNHLNACYSSTYHRGLVNRMGSIYDETIHPAYSNLAVALNSHYLPGNVVKIVDLLSGVYLSTPHARSSYLQFLPTDTFLDTSAQIVNLLNDARSSLLGISNVNDIVSAFTSDRYRASVVKVVRLSEDALLRNTDFMLKRVEVPYSKDFLDLWSNQHYNASDATSARITAFDVADDAVNFQKFVHSQSFSYFENAMTSTFNTTTGRLEPGFMFSEYVPTTGANETSVFRIDGNGDCKFLNNTGFGSYATGAMLNNGKYCYNQVDTSAVRLPGSVMVTTNQRNVNQDAILLLTDMLGIGT